MIIEPTGDPGRYDREVLLAAHHWEGSWVSMQDIRRGPAPDNGLEVLYKSASFNNKMLGHGEPIRVREGERVLFRLLNASATQNVALALPGHRFTFGDKLVELNLKRPGLDFHSLRHTVAGRLDAAEVRSTDAARILGHTVEGETFGTYSQTGPGLKVLAGVIEAITYPGLKL
jgi:hypothetical protein